MLYFVVLKLLLKPTNWKINGKRKNVDILLNYRSSDTLAKHLLKLYSNYYTVLLQLYYSLITQFLFKKNQQTNTYFSAN